MRFKWKAARPRAAVIVIDEGRMHEIIREARPASVALNGPDGMLPQVQRAALSISGAFGIPAYVLGDTTWGACDLNMAGARTLAADILFNIGHTVNAEQFQRGVYMINAYDDVPFDAVAAKAAGVLAGRTVSLLTDSQHLDQIGAVKGALEAGGVEVVVGRGAGQLNDGQVFGCEFYPALDAAAGGGGPNGKGGAAAAASGKGADANAFMGQSTFHAAGVALATGLPTYVLDPYFVEVRDVTEFAEGLRKKATLAVYRAAEAESFGVIVGLRDGQMSKTAGLRIRRELEAAGKRVQLIALTDITADALRRFTGIDAFVQAACPRISTDNRFDVPVLSVPQFGALLRVLRGEEPGGYLRAPHWL